MQSARDDTHRVLQAAEQAQQMAERNVAADRTLVAPSAWSAALRALR